MAAKSKMTAKSKMAAKIQDGTHPKKLTRTPAGLSVFNDTESPNLEYNVWRVEFP